MKKTLLLLLAIIGLNSITSAQQPGALDLTFNPIDVGFGLGDGADKFVYTTTIQSDGKIMIGGDFTSYNGTGINRIARLNADGSLDATFNPGTVARSSVYTISIQSDGKIVIGGQIFYYSQIKSTGIARLNADGSLDNSFNPGTRANDIVYATSIQSDGKILIGGSFDNYNGTARNNIARLNADGSLDASFNPGTGAIGTNDRISTISIQSDGKILIGGAFYKYNETARYNFARLNADGSLDASFNPETEASDIVYATSIQSDGKILIGGSFNTYYGTGSIARLNTNGSLDETFNPGTGASGSISTISILSDGKILIGGSFQNYNGTERINCARINADGNLDETFNTGIVTVYSSSIQSDGKIVIGKYNGVARLNTDGSLDATFNRGTGVNSSPSSISIQSDGKIVIGGDFTSYNGTAINRIARLNTNGSLDETFNTGSGANGRISTISIQSDGKILIGGSFASYNGITRNRIARLNTDGSLDDTFNPAIGENKTINSTAIQSDGKIVISGSTTFATYYIAPYIARLNADGSLDETFTNPIPPKLSDNQFTGMAIQSDGKIVISHYSWGYKYVYVHLYRFNTDGSIDDTFNSAVGGKGSISPITIQSDGKILVSGGFYSSIGLINYCFARLNADGSLDATFNPGTGASSGISTISIQSDGKILIGGSFTSYNGITRNRIARLNADGSLDNSFNPETGASASITNISIQSDGNIIIGGPFTSYNGTGRNRIARIYGGEATGVNEPEISSNLKVYPNPILNELNIEVEDSNLGSSIEIINSMGQVVYKGNFTERTHVNTNQFTSGIYVLKLTTGKKTEFRKIIKQ